jgi:hypothetical protein
MPEVLPLVPIEKVIWAALIAAFTGLVLLLRDQHARDAGWTFAAGQIFIGFAFTIVVLASAWNLTVGATVLLGSKQQELAIVTPPRE